MSTITKALGAMHDMAQKYAAGDECRICGDSIHPERRAVSPRAVTCSPACSAENLRKLRLAAGSRYRARKKVAKGAERALGGPDCGTPTAPGSKVA